MRANTRMAMGEELQDTQEKLQEMEEEVEARRQEVEEAKIGREEVEESLLDTQGLVEAMEDKLQEADNKHRQEVAEMEVKLRRMESAKEQISGESNCEAGSTGRGVAGHTGEAA